MRLLEVDVRHRQEGVCLIGLVQRESTRDQVEISFTFDVGADTFVSARADPFAAALLLPAMRVGEPLEIAPPLSPRLCVSLPRIRDIFHAWWPHLFRIPISTQPGAIEFASGGASTFFSGGVDSFYSLLKHRRGFGPLPVPMSYLIFMRGIESKVEWSDGVGETETWVREIAAAENVRCIIGQTNVRTILQEGEDNSDWEKYHIGSDLAAVALALSGGMSYVCIPSAFTYNHLIAHGSTPLADEMYSSEATYILHDGSEISRADKVAKIVEWNSDLVLRYLRVCHMNRGGAFNCGECPKCVRTAVPLRVLGLWDRAQTFQNKASDHWVEMMAEDHIELIEENLQFALTHNADTELISMIKCALRYARRREQAFNRRQRMVKRIESSALRPLLYAARQIRKSLRERTLK